MSSFYDGWMTVGCQRKPLWIGADLPCSRRKPRRSRDSAPGGSSSVRKRENRLAASILDLGHPQLPNRVDDVARHREVVDYLRQLAALGVSPVEEFQRFGRSRRIVRLFGHEDEGGTGDRPGLRTGFVGQDDGEARRSFPVGAAGSGRERLKAGRNGLSGPVNKLVSCPLTLPPIPAPH